MAIAVDFYRLTVDEAKDRINYRALEIDGESLF